MQPLDPVAVWVAIGVGLCAVASLAANVYAALAHRKTLTQKPVLELAQEYVRRADLDRELRSVETRLAELQSYSHTEIHALRGLIQNVQLEIAKMQRAVSLEITQEVGKVWAEVRQVNGKMDALMGAFRSGSGPTPRLVINPGEGQP